VDSRLGPKADQWLAILNRMAIVDQDVLHDPYRLAFDRVLHP
jgi:hypothetical protein